ncbi:MAG: hypothetical protein U0841_04215 [Chloroflexia bacterium]
MSNNPTNPAALERDFAALLDRCDAALARARSDDELLALRDLLLDWQFATRQLITAAEERLGAFDGDDNPRALATRAELLIEQIEALQDSWESRVNLLMDAEFNEEGLASFSTTPSPPPPGASASQSVFTGIVADMDQTGEYLDYARRYLLSLVVPPPERARPTPGPARGNPPARDAARPRPPRR